MTKSDYQDVADWYDMLFHDWIGASVEYYELLSEYRIVTGPWPSRAVDVACGTGVVTAALARMATEVIGVDRSQAMLDVAAARLAGATNVTLCCQGWADLNLTVTGGAFVTCLGNSLSHCLEDDVLAQVLVHLRRIAGGGPIIIDSRSVKRMAEFPVNRVRGIAESESSRMVIRDTWVEVSPNVYDMIFDVHVSRDAHPDRHLRKVLRYRSDLIDTIMRMLTQCCLEIVMHEQFVDEGDPWDIVVLRTAKE